MTTRSPVLTSLTALALAIYGLALGGTGVPGQAHEVPRVAPVQETAQLPFACSLLARSDGGGTVLEGRLQAREAISASYALRVRGPGVSIDQEGDLSLVAGEAAILGEASVSGAATTLDAILTVTVAGQTYSCPLQQS